MFKTVFLILLFAHLLGDFYLQGNGLSEKKQTSIRALLIHSLLYAVSAFIVILPVLNEWLVIVAAWSSIFHLSIDAIKGLYLRKFPLQKGPMVFITDQILHITVLGILAYVAATHMADLYILPVLTRTLQVMGISPYMLFLWTFMLLLLWRPTNISIKTLLASYKPVEEESSVTASKRAGGFIGLLERVIILIFLSIGQYAAIGLVLTAKSIARYDKIAHDKDFAEYYLLGTLLSTAIVIAVYLLVF